MILTKLKGAAVLVALHALAGVGLLTWQGAEAPAANRPIDRPDESPGPLQEAPTRLEMTLDAAIERSIRETPALRPENFEIPQARADILTASLRANPTFYADAQLVPYGLYTRNRPGGQTQYDVNISHPLDLTRKRRARAASADRPTKVIEAQYQDAVRLQIDRLSAAFVEALAASRVAEIRAEGLARLEESARDAGDPILRRIEMDRTVARAKRAEAAESRVRAIQALGSILGLKESEVAGLEVIGELGQVVPIPGTEDLVADALATRPDLASHRIGLSQARADVKLQQANRFEDCYVLQQPYTFQDNRPFDLNSPLSYALGVTIPLPIYNRNQGNIERAKVNVAQTQVQLTSMEIPLPIYNRNQGNIERAKLNVHQTQVQLTSMEQQVIAEVGRLRQECISSDEAAQTARATADEARGALERIRSRPSDGGEGLLLVLEASARREEAARVLVEAQARHWRSRLALNTAVGRRVVP